MSSIIKNLWKKSALEMISLLKNKEVSPREALDSILSRIEETNEDINAIVTICEKRAIEKIEGLTSNLNNIPGFLHGLPIVIKDLTDVKGVKTTYGSTIYKNHVPTESDYLVQRIEYMGGIVIGKSNTPEFGAGSQTFNKVFGATSNPWNNNYTSGGSSGGTAAALAAGSAWLGTGSDLGGSLRNPASFCGVVGLRPTPGIVPHGPTNLPFDTLSVNGPMARTVKDLSLFLDTMASYDYRDPISNASPKYSYQSAINANFGKLKIAFTDDYNILPCDSEVRSALDKSKSIFKNLGHSVYLDSPDFTDAENTFQVLRAHQLAKGKRELYINNKNLLKDDLRLNIEKGLSLTEDEISKAELSRGKIIKNINEFFKKYDLLVAPSSMVPPFSKEEYWPKKVENTFFDNYVSWLMTAATISLTGYPALAVPCAFSKNKLPIGIQIIAKPRNEHLLISVGSQYQSGLDIKMSTPINPIT